MNHPESSIPKRKAAPRTDADPYTLDLEQALAAARLGSAMPPAIFRLVGAIVAGLFAADAKAPEVTP